MDFLADGVPRAQTHSVFKAPVVGGGERFPVVLFSPGSGGVRTQNTAWAEELASHGYVVVALDYPYDSAVVVLADGRTIHTEIASTGDRDKDDRPAVDWTAVRAADLSFALTQLDHLDRGEMTGPLTGRLDTRRVAVNGHSMGGAVTLQAARQDQRLDAQSTKRPANPWSAQIFRTLGWSRQVHSSERFAPSRSWTFAAMTWTASSRPRVSVTMNLLRPLTFLPAAKPLVAVRTVSVVRVLFPYAASAWRGGKPALGVA